MENWKEDVNSAGISREDRAQYIVTLLREREGCERRGLKERVKLINVELKRYGYEAEKPADRAERRPAAPTVQKR